MMGNNALEYIRTAHTIHHFFKVGEHYYLWEIYLDPEFEEENKVKMMDIGGWKDLDEELAAELICKFLSPSNRLCNDE